MGLVVLCGSVVLSACSSSSPKAAKAVAKVRTTTTTTQRPATTTTAATIPPPTTTVPPSTTTTISQAVVKAWFTSNAGLIQALQNDLNQVTDSGNAGNVKGVLAGCTQLGIDTAMTQKLPPIPDPDIQSDWADSLSAFASAASACTDGLTTSNVTEMSAYKDEIKSGISEQQTALILYKGLQ
jgi:hypothetical protein